MATADASPAPTAPVDAVIEGGRVGSRRAPDPIAVPTVREDPALAEVALDAAALGYVTKPGPRPSWCQGWSRTRPPSLRLGSGKPIGL